MARFGVLHFEHGGKSYELDLDHLRAWELELAERHAEASGLLDLLGQLFAQRPVAWKVCLMLAMRRAGESVRVNDLSEMDVGAAWDRLIEEKTGEFGSEPNPDDEPDA